MIYSVWSKYNHRFMSTDCEEHESCLTCGAMFVLRDLGDGRGEYTDVRGDEPMECSGDTSMVHGYQGERVCESCDGIEGCEHCQHNCNCLFCDS